MKNILKNYFFYCHAIIFIFIYVYLNKVKYYQILSNITKYRKNDSL